MFIADLHIHSAYSRATSREALPPQLELAARRKGLGLIATGDFTHPAYRQLLARQLIAAEDGLYRLTEEARLPGDGLAADQERPRFIISGEISSIYKDKGRVRKIHNVILLPSLEAAESLSGRLEALGCNLRSDGRPIIGLPAQELLELTLDICPEAIFIPAHIWTPHFSLFGAYSGYDSIEDCFGSLTSHIHALETGLSSDPPMNWRLSSLDPYHLVSNSDAHSPDKLAREANIFTCPLSYPDIAAALADREGGGLAATIEFFPEEGKYHADGHRGCQYWQDPREAEADGLCPVCGKPLTIGVLHRAKELADRPAGFRPAQARPFESLVPLAEVVAASLGMTIASRKAREHYQRLLAALGPELYILRQAPLEEVGRAAGPCVAEGLRRLREGRVSLRPGYDGEYGKVAILTPEDIDRLTGQEALFPGLEAAPPARKKASPRRPAPRTPAQPAPLPTEAEGCPYGLSAAQWQAASAMEPTVAVLAGPGCGKTRTLVSRVAWLVEQGVDPAQISAVTFTNKAAREMRQRLGQLLSPEAAASLHIGTFHAIALARATARGHKVRLLDPYQAAIIAGEVCASQGSRLNASALLRQVSRLKNGGPAEDEALCRVYMERQRQYGVWDFDDVLLEELKDAEKGRADMSPFRYVLADEFQDVNDMQFRLIEAWSRDSASLFVIGDPDQSIYGFRGSDSQCFARLQAARPELAIYCLADNYRSTPQIVAAASAVLPPAIAGLRAAAPDGPLVRLLDCNSPLNEGIAIAKDIAELIGGVEMLQAHGRASKEAEAGLNDIAVLYRTHRQAETIAYCLETEGIPYRLAGKDEFLAQAAVGRTLSFFRLLLHPEDIMLLRTCLMDAEVPPEEREALLAAYSGLKRPAWAALARLTEELDASPPARLLAQLAAAWGPKARRVKPERLAAAWIEAMSLEGAAGIEQLERAALMYDSLAQLVEDMLAGADGDLLRSGGPRCAAEAVTLLTLHAAKGLEFPRVYMAGVRDGLIPLRAGGDLDEERRLFYVGMTRAEKQLTLLTGEEPSPFLASIPPALLSRESKKKQAAPQQLRLFE